MTILYSSQYWSIRKLFNFFLILYKLLIRILIYFPVIFTLLRGEKKGEKNMKKIIAIIMVGMFVVVGCGSIVMAEDDDPVFSNRPPKAPVLIEEQSQMEKDCYTYVFYAEDPDGDQVYYDIAWNRIGEPKIITCSPDDPVVPWLGPFESGEELEKLCTFDKSGEYELTIRAKDTHDNIGPSTTITVTYKSMISKLPILFRLMEKYPEIFKILAKIF